jgi:cytosine/adenosine deaminase-related metal-dependent hydrolase
MSLIIKNISLLLENDLEFINCGYIVIGKDGLISHAGQGDFRNTNKHDKVFDGEGLLACPGFVNAHTHIGDSIGKDMAIDIDLDLDQMIHPLHGLKKKILDNSHRDHLITFIKSSTRSMLKRGIVAFADFREGGSEGIKLLNDALFDTPIKYVALGRPEYYFTIHPSSNGEKVDRYPYKSPKETLSANFNKTSHKILEVCDGFGISGANENSDESLNQYRKVAHEYREKSRRNIIVAIHAAESEQTVTFSVSATEKSEVQRILLNLMPDFIVHMTNASDEDIARVAEQGVGIVVCPRSNGILGVGFPRVAKMLRLGCHVGIGTDNVMINSPDMFREMDYLWKVSRTIDDEFLSARDVLKMATVNGGKILKIKSGSIAPNMSADLIFFKKDHIDLAPLHNPYAAIVHRADMDSIHNVMINGRLIDGEEF